MAYTMDREDKVGKSNKIFIINISTACLMGQQWFLITWNGFILLKNIKSKTSQFKIIVKWLAHFNLKKFLILRTPGETKTALIKF